MDATGERAPRTRVVTAAVGSSAFVALLWVLEAFDAATGQFLDPQFFDAGVVPRSIGGLDGILFAPLLHGDFAHLASNSVPLLVLGFLILLGGITRFLGVTAVVWLVGGVGVWLLAGSGENHLGASVLVFGWLAYLLLRGLFTRDVGQIVLGLVLLVVYGGLIWGVLPGQEGISWQGHLFGAVGGGLCAYASRPARTTPAPNP